MADQQAAQCHGRHNCDAAVRWARLECLPCKLLPAMPNSMACCCGLSPVASHPACCAVDMSCPAVDRLYMLEGQCGAWGSIIAAAVHVPLVQGKIVSGELRVSAVQLCDIHKCRPACICLAQDCWASPACLLSRLCHPFMSSTTELADLHGRDLSAPLDIIAEFHERMEKRGRCACCWLLLVAGRGTCLETSQSSCRQRSC